MLKKFNSEEMQEINRGITFSDYARNKVKLMGNEIADIAGKLELSSGMVVEGILDLDFYKGYALRQRREIKDRVAEIYSFLNLSDVNGHFDDVFKREGAKDV